MRVPAEEMNKAMRRALRRRYPMPEWSLFEELRSGTGHHHRTTADGLAMGCYPSRGMEIHGIEIKVERRDWLREKDNPDKAEAIASYCDRWWLAIYDDRIARLDEVPAAWGVYVLNGESFKMLREARKLKPKTLDRPFVASLLRNANQEITATRSRFVAPEKLDERVAMEVAAKRADWERAAHQELLALRHEHDRIKSDVAKFEAQTGLSVRHYFGPTDGKIQDAIRALEARDDLLNKLHWNIKNLNDALYALQLAQQRLMAGSPKVSDPDG